jgi:hypothetical protein
MPYKSLAQERYFNANRAKLERQGVDVAEWNSASKGKKLPARKSKKPKGVLGGAKGKRK